MIVIYRLMSCILCVSRIERNVCKPRGCEYFKDEEMTSSQYNSPLIMLAYKFAFNICSMIIKKQGIDGPIVLKAVKLGRTTPSEKRSGSHPTI